MSETLREEAATPGAWPPVQRAVQLHKLPPAPHGRQEGGVWLLGPLCYLRGARPQDTAQGGGRQGQLQNYGTSYVSKIFRSILCLLLLFL